MNLDKAIQNAYVYNKKVGRKSVYLAIDIHDTIAHSNYADEMPEVIETAMDALRRLNKFPEIVLILFSSSYNHDAYIKHFQKYGVDFTYFNENPEICDSKTGDFSKKFFYNLLIDDKAGFELRDWEVVVNSVTKHRAVFEEEKPAEPEIGDYVYGHQFMAVSSTRTIQYGPFMSRDKAVEFRNQMISDNKHKYSRFVEFSELMRAHQHKIVFAHFGNSGVVDSEMRKWKEFLLDSRPEFKEMDQELYNFEEIQQIKIYV